MNENEVVSHSVSDSPNDKLMSRKYVEILFFVILHHTRSIKLVFSATPPFYDQLVLISNEHTVFYCIVLIC